MFYKLDKSEKVFVSVQHGEKTVLLMETRPCFLALFKGFNTTDIVSPIYVGPFPTSFSVFDVLPGTETLNPSGATVPLATFSGILRHIEQYYHWRARVMPDGHMISPEQFCR